MDLKPTKFEDEQGRTWDARINYRGLRELAAAGLPLQDIEQHLQELLFGSPQLFEWLWALMRDQAKPHKLEREAFCEAMFECSGRALDSFLAGVENFFRNLNPTRADLFAAALREVENEAQSVFSKDASSLAGNAESTPETTPSES